MHLLFVCHATTGANPAASAAVALANGMAARGHAVTLCCQRPVPRPLYPLYRLGCRLNRLSLPEGVWSCPPRGVKPVQAVYALHPAIRLLPYVFTDRNLTIQKLRGTLRTLALDACVCQFAGREQLAWAVTLLGSGIPFVYSELLPPETVQTQWDDRERLVAMSGADRIHMLSPEFTVSLPDWMRDRVRALPAPASSGTDDAALFDAWENLLAEAAAEKGATVMDAFEQEPFASQARMYSVARREWLWRDFGQPIPGTLEAWLTAHWYRTKNVLTSLWPRRGKGE